MPPVALLSRVQARTGHGPALIAAFESLLAIVDSEPGTLLYVLHQSRQDPELLWVSELYSNDDAFARHRDSEAMAAITPVLAELIAESEVMIGQPLSGKGLPR